MNNLAIVLNNGLRQYRDPASFARAMTDKYLAMSDAERTSFAVAMIAEIAAQRVMQRSSPVPAAPEVAP